MRSLILLIVLTSSAAVTLAQEPSISRERVADLVKQLDAAKGDARNAAEKSLIDLGPGVLPLLPKPDGVKSAEQAMRLERVRGALQTAVEDAQLAASTVTISGSPVPLKDVLEQLRKQTGNVVTDLREQMGEDVTNPELKLNIDKKPFFEALDEICTAARLAPNFFTGNGSIGLVTAAGPRSREVDLSGPFRIAFQQLVLSRDFAVDKPTGSAQFEFAWEPRLRPMLLNVRSEDVSIIDDLGRAVSPSTPAESFSIVVRPDNPATPLEIGIEAPDRQAKRLTRVEVTARVTLPAGLHEFAFPSIAKGGEQTHEKLTVTLDKAHIEEHVWKVRVTLDYGAPGPAFESFQEGAMSNRIWLVGPDKGRIELTGPHGGGFSTLGADGGRMMFEYLFVDVPGKLSDYGLVYEAPTHVIVRPVTFSFHDVPLP